MITQKFKGDNTELKMEAVATPAMNQIGVSLNEYLESGFDSDPFLLMLYDAGRMPFSDRIPRDSFVAFIKEGLKQFPVTGTFDAYLFIIDKVFGEGSGIVFDVTGPGKLSMLINASSTLLFDATVREFDGTSYIDYELIDNTGDNIEFGGISGIDSEYKLNLLLSEIIPAGIVPDVTLAFFTLYDCIFSVGGFNYGFEDYLGNQIVFIE